MTYFRPVCTAYKVGQAQDYEGASLSRLIFAFTSIVFVLTMTGCDDGEESRPVLLAGSGTAGSGSGAGGSGGLLAVDAGSGFQRDSSAAGGAGMGGSAGSGGTPGTGGSAGSGGTPGAGGSAGSGGTPGAGGSAGSGGSAGAGGSAGGSGPAPAEGTLGAACAADGDCEGGVCINDFPMGYCSKACNTAEDCGANGSCWELGERSLCLLNCQAVAECRVADGYTCDGDNTCYPGQPAGPAAPVGAPCEDAVDCVGPNNRCLAENSADGPTGFVGGYCYQLDCGAEQPCPNGSECFTISEDGTTACLASCAAPQDCRPGYACQDVGACLPGCMGDASCPEGTVCREDGTCAEPPCTPDSCPEGTVCGEAGRCIIDIGDVPAGPVPNCDGVVSWACENDCGRLLPFEPIEGPGYINYPLNGETSQDQYRSYARRDTIMLVKYAAAKTDCLAANWGFGLPGLPLGLGDMSEANGEIPGTREGRPGHPPGTHVNGFDMDIAYYQMMSPNNYLRSICEHYVNGRDQYHCVDEPDNFDVWRTALFLAALHDSPQLRIIGVDGRVGPLINAATEQLCDAGYLSGRVCAPASRLITYEETDMGQGWFRFHHHHFHMSLTSRARAGLAGLTSAASSRCLRSDCGALPSPENDPRRHHVHTDEPSRLAPHSH